MLLLILLLAYSERRGRILGGQRARSTVVFGMARRSVIMPPKRPSQKKEYPYLYLNHGPLLLESFQKCESVHLGFADALTEDLVLEIRQRCPFPLRGTASYWDTLLCIEAPDDDYTHHVIRSFGNHEEQESLDENYPDIGQETANDFSAAMAAWVAEVHMRSPLVFVVGPGRNDPDEKDNWHQWSHTSFTNTFVPFLDAFLKRNPSLSTNDAGQNTEKLAALEPAHIHFFLKNHFDPDPRFGVAIPVKHQARLSELRDLFKRA